MLKNQDHEFISVRERSDMSSINRKYGEIWSRLKRDKTVSIVAHRALHPRILKAVRKERWLDIEYKMTVEPRVIVMDWSSKFSTLTITIALKIPVTEIARFL